MPPGPRTPRRPVGTEQGWGQGAIWDSIQHWVSSLGGTESGRGASQNPPPCRGRDSGETTHQSGDWRSEQKEPTHPYPPFVRAHRDSPTPIPLVPAPGRGRDRIRLTLNHPALGHNDPSRRGRRSSSGNCLHKQGNSEEQQTNQSGPLLHKIALHKNNVQGTLADQYQLLTQRSLWRNFV